MNDLLKTIAPLLGTALGGPLGGAAASFIAGKLGMSETTVEAVTDVLCSGKMTPDQIANVKLAELDFKKFLETNKIDVMKIDAADRADARKREADTGDHTTPRLLALFAVLCFIGLVFGVMRGVDVAVGMKDTFLILIGAAIAVFKDVYGYYFGSSSGSRENQAAMRDAMK